MEKTQVKKKRRYKKFKDMTRPQQIKLVRSLTIVGLILTSLIVFVAVLVVRHFSAVKADSENEGDIFSRGYGKGESSIIIEEADIPSAIRDSIRNAESEKDSDMTKTYEGLKHDNPDFAGYLKIEGTDIEYPVMYSPDEPERYLEKDFDLNKSIKGLPFIDARCKLDPVSENLIIYGHNMKDGTVFGLLDSYDTKEFCRQHPVIRFDTLNDPGKYEVMYAFYDRVYFNDEKEFRFYNFIDASNKDDFDRTMDKLREKSIYDMGVKADFGDRFITLVTCSYQEEEGRFVVIAKKI